MQYIVQGQLEAAVDVGVGVGVLVRGGGGLGGGGGGGCWGGGGLGWWGGVGGSVLVGVGDGVLVGVKFGVLVGVGVGVLLGVAVGALVGVAVGVGEEEEVGGQSCLAHCALHWEWRGQLTGILALRAAEQVTPFISLMLLLPSCQPQIIYQILYIIRDIIHAD